LSPRSAGQVQRQVGIYFLLAAVLVLLPVILGLERGLRDRLIAARLAALVPAMRAITEGMAGRVEAAEARTLRLAWLVGSAGPTVDAREVARFDALVERGADGAWRSRRFDATREAGVFVLRGVEVDPELKTLLMQSKRVVELFGAGTLDPRFADAWFLASRGGEVIYVADQPTYVYEEEPDEDYRESVFYLPVTPDSNPDRAPRWTAPFYSERTVAWYVAAVAPVWRESRFIGSVGQDLSLEALVDYNALTPLEVGGRFLVLSREGIVLIGDSATVRTPGRAGGLQLGDVPELELRDSLAAALRDPPPGGQIQSVALSDGRLLVGAIPRTGWIIASVVPRDALTGPIRASLRLLRGALIGVFILLLGASLGAIGREIRRREATEEGLRRSEERFNRLFQLSPEGVCLTRLSDQHIQLVNDRFVTMSGFSREQIIGRRAVDLGFWANPDHREAVMAKMRRDGEVDHFPSELLRRDGTRLEVEVSARLVEVEGEPHMLTLVRDTSQRRALERQLAQAQKLEAVGRLAGGVAHDFNNIVTAILGHAEMARDVLPDDSLARDDLSQIIRASGRATELTGQLLMFSRRQVAQPRRTDLNTLVDETRRLFERLIGADVELRILRSDMPVIVHADPGQLEQVLMNLVVNARDAMPSGGSLTVRVGQRDGRALVEVQDTGIGMSPDIQARIFEPFFTTKERGKGTGLGLAMCYGIVHQAGGTIDVVSVPGEGSTFRVLLPLASADTPEGRTALWPATPASSLGGTETILLAEDEPMVRDLAIRVLEGLGYRVLVGKDGSEALAIADGIRERIHLLLTDVVMPGLSGPELAQRLTAERPGLAVLYVSGYAPDSAALAEALRSGAAFLPKPYNPADLAREVRATLDRLIQ
jgi:two-component system cell cycle sensor histidine kinase/response regulator CckA